MFTIISKSDIHLIMDLSLHENMKVERVEGSVAIVTVRVPLEHLDGILALADYIIHVARRISTGSRVAIASARAKDPVYQAAMLVARADIARADAAARADRRASEKRRKLLGSVS